MIARLVALAVLLVVCSACDQKPKHPPVPLPADPDAALEETRAVYLSLQPSVADAHGFIETNKCDSVTFSALIGAAGAAVDVRAAVDADGSMHRLPLEYPECYPERSKSRNSKDVFDAVLVNGLVTGDRALLEQTFAYGKAHGWVMGPGVLSRTFMPTTLRGQYARAIRALGGTEHKPEVSYDQVWTPGLTGYEAHLQVTSILTYGRTFGGVTDVGLARLREHRFRQPRNPFYAAAYWRYSGDEAAAAEARESLRNAQWFPPDRLPTSADRCDPWMIQRDDGPDWLPCPDEARTHSGGDFLLAHAVLTGRI